MNHSDRDSMIQSLLAAARDFSEQPQPALKDPAAVAAAEKDLESSQQLADYAEGIVRERQVSLCESNLRLARARLDIRQARQGERNLNRECVQRREELFDACSTADATAIAAAAKTLADVTLRYRTQRKILSAAHEAKTFAAKSVENDSLLLEGAKSALTQAEELVTKARKTYNKVYRVTQPETDRLVQLRRHLLKTALKVGGAD